MGTGSEENPCSICRLMVAHKTSTGPTEASSGRVWGSDCHCQQRAQGLMWPRGTPPSHLGQKPLATSASQGHQFVKELPLGDTQHLYVAERALNPSQSRGTKYFLDSYLIPMQTKYFYLNGEQRRDEGLPSTHVQREVVQGPSLGTDGGSLCRL